MHPRDRSLYIAYTHMPLVADAPKRCLAHARCLALARCPPLQNINPEKNPNPPTAERLRKGEREGVSKRDALLMQEEKHFFSFWQVSVRACFRFLMGLNSSFGPSPRKLRGCGLAKALEHAS